MYFKTKKIYCPFYVLFWAKMFQFKILPVQENQHFESQLLFKEMDILFSFLFWTYDMAVCHWSCFIHCLTICLFFVCHFSGSAG